MPLKLVKKGRIWHVTGTVNGQRVRESSKTSSRDHAEAYRRDLERDLEDRTYHGAASFADAFLIYAEKGGEKTHIGPILDRFGATKLKEITPSAVSALSQERYGHMEASSVKRYLYTPLNAVMRAANRAQLCPLIRFDPPKVKRKPVEYADDAWFRKFFEHAHPRIALTVMFLTLTAARVSEACRLAVTDVDLERGFAVLRKTKNGKSRRIILPSLLGEALGRWIEEQKLVDPAARVFGYAARWSVNQAIERVCKKAGIAVKSSHKVGRHAFAARLLAEGKGLRFVQEAGGWAGIQIVAETYGHLEQSAIDDALRETGNAAITKVGSNFKMLSGPETDGQVSGKMPETDALVEAIQKRHSLEKSGELMVGATGIEPVTPTMSRLWLAATDGEKSHKNRPLAREEDAGTGAVHDVNMS